MLKRKRRREAKRRVVDVIRREVAAGVSFRAAAAMLEIPVQTARDWARAERTDSLESATLGRPCRSLAARGAAELAGSPLAPEQEERRRVDELLRETRGEASIRALQHAAPHASRRSLKRCRTRYRRALRRHMEHLVWERAGAVWAADFTEPNGRMDGRLRYVLCVRDLASGMQLAALAVEHADSLTAARVIDALCRQHGAPLVLKTDNGSHFKGALAAVISRWKIAHLLSPPSTPRYNGSIEASIGMLTALAERMAAAPGRPPGSPPGSPPGANPGSPAEWDPETPSGGLTEADFEAARIAANHRELDRCGSSSAVATAEGRWRLRTIITDSERSAFLAAVADATRDEAVKMEQRRSTRRAIRVRRRAAAPSNSAACAPLAPSATPAATALPLDKTDRATVVRRAIRRTLVAIGALTTWRRSDMST